jgi:hypothetical protein
MLRKMRKKKRREFAPPPKPGPRLMSRPGGAGVVDRRDPTGRLWQNGFPNG